MRTRFLFVAIAAAVLCGTFIGCKQNSYAQSLKDEKKLIADFIAREHINIIYEEPKDGKWGEKDYLDLSSLGYDNFYFHLDKQGDTTAAAVKTGDMIVFRYRRYTLDVNADTVSYWTTAQNGYPLEFSYQTDYNTACLGWHYAVRYMKYSGAEAKIINPSKLGFANAEGSTVTPYGYDMKITIRRF